MGGRDGGGGWGRSKGERGGGEGAGPGARAPGPGPGLGARARGPGHGPRARAPGFHVRIPIRCVPPMPKTSTPRPPGPGAQGSGLNTSLLPGTNQIQHLCGFFSVGGRFRHPGESVSETGRGLISHPGVCRDSHPAGVRFARHDRQQHGPAAARGRS